MRRLSRRHRQTRGLVQERGVGHTGPVAFGDHHDHDRGVRSFRIVQGVENDPEPQTPVPRSDAAAGVVQLRRLGSGVRRIPDPTHLCHRAFRHRGGLRYRFRIAVG